MYTNRSVDCVFMTFRSIGTTNIIGVTLLSMMYTNQQCPRCTLTIVHDVH